MRRIAVPSGVEHLVAEPPTGSIGDSVWNWGRGGRAKALFVDCGESFTQRVEDVIRRR